MQGEVRNIDTLGFLINVISLANLGAMFLGIVVGLIVGAIFSGHLAVSFETPDTEIGCAMYMREMPSLK